MEKAELRQLSFEQKKESLNKEIHKRCFYCGKFEKQDNLLIGLVGDINKSINPENVGLYHLHCKINNMSKIIDKCENGYYHKN